MSIQRFITGIQNLSKKIVLINNFPSYFPKHLPTSLVLSQVKNSGFCLHYCSHLNFSRVIPLWGISKNKIKRGFKKIHCLLKRCFLLHQMYIVRKLSDGGGLKAAPPTSPARLFCKWPSQAGAPSQEKMLARSFPWWSAMCLEDHSVGMTMSLLKARKCAFAVTVCRGGKSWLFCERQIRASLTHSNLPCQTPGHLWRNLSPSRTLPVLSIPIIMTDIRRPMGKEDFNP